MPKHLGEFISTILNSILLIIKVLKSFLTRNLTLQLGHDKLHIFYGNLFSF